MRKHVVCIPQRDSVKAAALVYLWRTREDRCELLWQHIFQRCERRKSSFIWAAPCVAECFSQLVCVCVQRWTQHRSPLSAASTEVYLGFGVEHVHVYTGGLNPWPLTPAQTSSKPPGDRLIGPKNHQQSEPGLKELQWQWLCPETDTMKICLNVTSTEMSVLLSCMF